ncbi:MAG: sigma-70 family RNA polymerase sigma factor [Acidimicrobiia bacterium]|nr:sigma-70 family RNA polymerase sigma factor [Acidimicrobiia bacterium]
MRSPESEFEDVFLDNYERLVSSLTAIVGDRELARDCVQEAFIKASTRWRKISRYDDPAAWIRRVAINRSRDHLRSSTRRQRREVLVSPDAGIDADSTGLVDSSITLGALLRTLPERQRAAASLYYLEDLPVADIAVSLGISDGAVKYHLNQARSALRVVVERQEQRHG